MSRFLGIDLGTQSLKAVINDGERREMVADGDGASFEHGDHGLVALRDSADAATSPVAR